MGGAEVRTWIGDEKRHLDEAGLVEEQWAERLEREDGMGRMRDGLLFEEIADDDDDVSEEPMAWIGVDACGELEPSSLLISGQCWMDHRKKRGSRLCKEKSFYWLRRERLFRSGIDLEK